MKTNWKTSATSVNGTESAEGNPTFQVEVYRHREGGSVPNYRQKIASGESATSAFIGDSQTYQTSPMSASGSGESGIGTQHVTYRGEVSGYPVGFGKAPWPGNNDSEIARNQALEGLIGQIRKTQRSFQGGTFLGELSETLRMIKNPVKTLRRELDFYYLAAKKRAARTKAHKRNRVIQDTWLEYQFGWAPLFQDAQDAFRTLQKRSKFFARGEFIPVGGRGESRLSFVENGPYPYEIAWNKFWFKEISIGESTFAYKGAVRGRSQNPITGSVSAWGFNPMTEFLPTVWEMIPYSFLVDYFTNVGTIINSWSACQADIAWLSATVRKQNSVITTTVRSEGFTQGSYNKQSTFSPGSSVAIRKTVARSSPPLESLVPSLAFKLPGSDTRWLNIGALQRLVRL
jgi:hypothetical protein